MLCTLYLSPASISRGNSCHHLERANKGQRDNYTMANCPTSRLAARHNEIISRPPFHHPRPRPFRSFLSFQRGSRLGVLNRGREREKPPPRGILFCVLVKLIRRTSCHGGAKVKGAWLMSLLRHCCLLYCNGRGGKKFLNIFAIALINVRGNYGGRELLTGQLEERQERDKTLVAEIRGGN